MRLKRTLVFAGIASALAGVTAVAAADRQPVHVMNVAMPDGQVEQIRYTGNVAPRILFRDVAAPDVAASFMDSAFGPDSPFAMMDRISAHMDRQMAGMMQQAAMMQRMSPAQLSQAMLAGAPKGANGSFTMISTTSDGGCTRTVRMTSDGTNQQPRVQRTSAGRCDSAVADPQALTPTAATAPAAAPAPIVPAVLPATPARPAPAKDSI